MKIKFSTFARGSFVVILFAAVYLKDVETTATNQVQKDVAIIKNRMAGLEEKMEIFLSEVRSINTDFDKSKEAQKNLQSTLLGNLKNMHRSLQGNLITLHRNVFGNITNLQRKLLRNSEEITTIQRKCECKIENGNKFPELEKTILAIEARLNSPLLESPPFQNEKVYLHSKLADEKKGDWFKNQRICEKYNAEMVSIHSEEENKYFINWARGSDVQMVHPGAWLAAQTHNHDINFTWNNVGVTRNYTNLSYWKFNEPGTNCLMLGWTDAFTWDDWYCNRELFIVCQRRL